MSTPGTIVVTAVITNGDPKEKCKDKTQCNKNKSNSCLEIMSKIKILKVAVLLKPSPAAIMASAAFAVMMIK